MQKCDVKNVCLSFKINKVKIKTLFLKYIDGSRAVSVWSILDYSPIIKQMSIDSCKCYLLQCRVLEMKVVYLKFYYEVV